MSKDLSVMDLVLLLEVEEYFKAGCVEVIQLPGITLIQCPRFTGVKQRGEYCCPVHIQLDLQTNASSVPDIGV